ncbi:MAG: hypothetical protein HZA34_04645 [Candidatus Pacebacteria bacterium]|nr:hypothetical protein [Candidatus Paceibacterota bacterium]
MGAGRATFVESELRRKIRKLVETDPLGAFTHYKELSGGSKNPLAHLAILRAVWDVLTEVAPTKKKKKK